MRSQCPVSICKYDNLYLSQNAWRFSGFLKDFDNFDVFLFFLMILIFLMPDIKNNKTVEKARKTSDILDYYPRNLTLGIG